MAKGMYRLKISDQTDTIYGDLERWFLDDGNGGKISFERYCPPRQDLVWLMRVTNGLGSLVIPFTPAIASFLIEAAAATWGLELQPTVANWVEEVTDEHE